MKIKRIILVLVIILAAFLRLWKLGEAPASPDWDEAALGYNAFSIMKTGRDEYGKFLPVLLRSFDDYKPGLYAYLIIPVIQLFGLSVWTVRLPSAIFGVLTVLATYFLTKELLSNAKFQNPNVKSIPKSKCQILQGVDFAALMATALLAVSPWHLQFSRVAFEANTGLAFNVFGLLFFLKAVGEKKQAKKLSFGSFKSLALNLKPGFVLGLAAFFYALSLYVYQSEKVFVPLMFLVLTLIFRKRLRQMKKEAVLAGIVFGLTALPFVWTSLTTPEAFLRAKGVSVFADQTPFLEQTVRKLARDRQRQDVLGLILDNRRVTYFLAFIGGYLSHFDLNWLFITGDQPRHQPPNTGHMYLWELPFLLAGVYFFVFGSWSKKSKRLLAAWVLITPTAAALTTGLPHPIRTLNFLPAPQILTALGVAGVIKGIWEIKEFKKVKVFVLLAFVGFGFLNFVYYLDQYFVQQNYYYSQYWQYGYEQTVRRTEEIKGRYDKIVVENRPHLDQSYMFFLFYTQYDPKKYLAEGGTETGGFAEGHYFSKYEFRPIDWEKEEKEKRLFAGRPEDFPEGVNILQTIRFLDGSEAIVIVEGG